MKASIVLLSYNQSKYINLIIKQLLKQKTQYSFEIIISDDSSNYKEISKIIKQIQEIKIPIYFIFQQDIGFRASKARNNGIKLSNGEIIITLDGDCIPSLDMVNRHIKAHENKNNILVYTTRDHGNIHKINKKNKIIINDSVRKREEEIKNNMLIWQRIWSFNISFKKNKNITLFDENFIGYGLEDTEFSYKLLVQNNYKV